MKAWTREETIIAFSVYCKIPFKESNKQHPMIKKYASIIGRSPSALNMKIGNIGRLDPELKDKGISGLSHGSKMEKEVWDEFYNNPNALAYESEKLIAEYIGQSIEETADIKIDDLPQGEEREILIKQRINQSFFRASVISAYNYRCCISGIKVPELIEACHIMSWADCPSQRTNPKNGICMNTFFHKAYDNHLIGITPDLKIDISDKLLQGTKDFSFSTYLKQLNGQTIMHPDKFLPQKEFLDVRYQLYRKIQH